METVRDPRICYRTLALWRPGEPISGVPHHYAWSGSVPCTGRLRCTLCGADHHNLALTHLTEGGRP